MSAGHPSRKPGRPALSHDVFTLFLLQAAAPAANSWMGFLPILLIFAIFYFLLFLPMQRQRKNTQKMLAALKNGDVVVTSGGIIGTIVAIESDELVLRVKPSDIKIQVTRSAVTGMAPEKK